LGKNRGRSEVAFRKKAEFSSKRDPFVCVSSGLSGKTSRYP